MKTTLVFQLNGCMISVLVIFAIIFALNYCKKINKGRMFFISECSFSEEYFIMQGKNACKKEKKNLENGYVE